MSDDQVKRYQLDYHHTQTYAEMVEDCDGDWVKYNDYKAASDRIEELELAVRYEADLAQQALDARKELAAKLAKAVEALADLADCVDDGCFCSEMQMATAMDNVRTTLAALKGQEDD